MTDQEKLAILIQTAEVAVGGLDCHESQMKLYKESGIPEDHLTTAQSVASNFVHGLKLLKAVLEEVKK